MTPSGRQPGALAYWMRALGRREMPESIEVGGQRLRHLQTVKHDFYAATGFYETPSRGRVVVKLGRTAPFAGIPLSWLGRWLSRREVRICGKLVDLPNVPPILGQFGKTGLVRAFVPGEPLSKQRPVPDGFFDQLHALMGQVHARGVAHVDTNKLENIILGEDRRPYLIDFQISWDRDRSRLGRWWLRHMQQEDIYHVLKHRRRLRADELTPEELARVRHRSTKLRVYRVVTRPYFLVRRPLLRWLRRTGRVMPSGSN